MIAEGKRKYRAEKAREKAARAIGTAVGEQSRTSREVLPVSSTLADQFRGLADVARMATTGSDHDLLRRVAVAAMAAMDGASVSLSVWDASSSQFRCVLNDGELGHGEVSEPTDEVYSLAEYRNLIPLLEQQHGLICAVDQDDQLDPYVAFLRQLGKGSCIAAPIPLDGRVWGELFVTRRLDQPTFHTADVDFAVAIAAQVGAAIATAENVGRAEVLAYTDSLTGLANRRAVDDWFEAAMAEHAVSRVPVGLVVCDVNGLKKINDQQGHDAGDRVLRQLARLLVDRCSGPLPDAVIGRLGGDEFAVGVKGVESDALVGFAEELTALAWRTLPFGVACGVAITGDAIGTIDNAGRLFRLADAAQYRAKRTGSRLPVIAGRALPVEASQPGVTDWPDTAPDRRLIRGKEGPTALHLLDAALRALDEGFADPLSARLALVADLVSHQVDAVGWWISAAAPGSDELATVEYVIYRALPGLTEQELAGEVGLRYSIGDYPATAQALGGGSFTVRADDPQADSGELAILDDLGSAGRGGGAGARTGSVTDGSWRSTPIR